MIGQRKRVRSVQRERRKRQWETAGIVIVLLVTLFLVWKAMQAG
ncbi:hypothetical protein GCM10027601_43200 [Nocardioides ungokensis]